MKLIRKSNEDEMILNFLQAEINSKRYNDKLIKVLKELNISDEVIKNGLYTKKQNQERKLIMKLYRGYPNEELFENFPQIRNWEFVKFSKNDIDKLHYIDYDYWNLLSNNTSLPVEAAKNIKMNKEVFGVSNKQYLEGLEYLKNNNFPPIILITCNKQKYLIIEGHLRVTVYSMDINKFNGSYGFIGYCNLEEMKKYDPRMI